MADVERDPLKESIQAAASMIDVEAARSADESSHPMLRLFQQELQGGASAEDALTRTVDRLSSVGEQVLEILDYPPRALGVHPFVRKMEERGISRDEGNTAVDLLMRTGKVDQINGWYFRKPEPLFKAEDLTSDDIDWLRGEGRWAQ